MTTEHQPEGNGCTEIAVGNRDGQVTLLFQYPMNWIALDPTNAAYVGKAIIDAAVDCGARVEIKTPPPQIPNALRERMINRCVMLLRNKREAPEKDGILAQRIVETLLNMVNL